MKKSRRGSIIFAVILIFIIIFSMMLLGNRNNSESDFKDQEQAGNLQEQEESPEEQAEDYVSFPVILEEGKLEVESLFQFSGINPDADKQEATDVAAIVLKNVSEEYLKTAKIHIVLDNGTEHDFWIQDLPAGKAVTAFATENGVLPAETSCQSLDAEVVFADVQNEAGVEVSVDGMTITLENVSGEDLYGIDVYYRDVFNDKYFGGITYKNTIEKMAAGESVMFTAVDTTLGIIEVIRIATNE